MKNCRATLPPSISLQAIAGTHAPQTMWIKGSLGHQTITVLIDSGSTHNFLNEKLAKRAGLRPGQGGAFEVMVASGEKLGGSNKCLDVPITLQGTPIHVDFVILIWFAIQIKPIDLDLCINNG